ncbi:MAG: radical SAM protein, partial [Dehalococcoidales bacterium]|nr:radical SAM protein [Dehalococcoidales bacterium]
MATNVALYIHVPFCLQKCSYCSFVSYTGRLQDAERYVQTVINEISKRAGGRKVKSIYFGGGTPSLIPANLLERLMENLKDYYSQGEAIEVSLEVNPGAVNEEYLKAIKSYGINRLSIGVQSLDNKELGRLGRLHDTSAAVKVMKSARSAGFDNINIDLIYGIPGQGLRSW